MKKKIKNRKKDKPKTGYFKKPYDSDILQSVLIITVFFIISLSVYILSIGPVAYLCEKYNWPQDKIEKVYVPVIWLHDNTFLKKPLEWYLFLFINPSFPIKIN